MTLGTAVAKKTAQSKPKENGDGDQVTLKVKRSLLRKAKMVAIHRDMDLFDYTDATFGAAVQRDYEAMLREEGR